MRSTAEALWNSSYTMKASWTGEIEGIKTLNENHFRSRKKCHCDRLNLRLGPNSLGSRLGKASGISHNQRTSSSSDCWEGHRKLLLTYKDNSAWTLLNKSFVFLLKSLVPFKCNAVGFFCSAGGFFWKSNVLFNCRALYPRVLLNFKVLQELKCFPLSIN